MQLHLLNGLFVRCVENMTLGLFCGRMNGVAENMVHRCCYRGVRNFSQLCGLVSIKDSRQSGVNEYRKNWTAASLSMKKDIHTDA